MARFWRSERSQNSGRIRPSPVPQPAIGVVILEPCQGASGGTENHPAPNDPKLGQLPRARQGLVRVPESNTKYGGKSGKTGGLGRSLLVQVSVSPQGFPREKNVPSWRFSGFRPLFTGQVFIAPEGLPWGDSRGDTEGPGRHARRPMARCPDKRHGGGDSHRLILP